MFLAQSVSNKHRYLLSLSYSLTDSVIKLSDFNIIEAAFGESNLAVGALKYITNITSLFIYSNFPEYQFVSAFGTDKNI